MMASLQCLSHEPFNDLVEGNAIKLADAAEQGNMGEAASLLGKISTGCVGCHAVFYERQINFLEMLVNQQHYEWFQTVPKLMWLCHLLIIH